MKKIICDRCGREIKESQSVETNNQWYDLCHACSKKYQALLSAQYSKSEQERITWLKGGKRNENTLC